MFIILMCLFTAPMDGIVLHSLYRSANFALIHFIAHLKASRCWLKRSGYHSAINLRIDQDTFPTTSILSTSLIPAMQQQTPSKTCKTSFTNPTIINERRVLYSTNFWIVSISSCANGPLDLNSTRRCYLNCTIMCIHVNLAPFYSTARPSVRIIIHKARHSAFGITSTHIEMNSRMRCTIQRRTLI